MSHHEELRRTNQEPTHVTWAREARGLNKAQLAASIGKTRSLIHEIENGTRNATPAVLAAIAETLGCPISLLERRVRPTWAEDAA